MEHSRGVSINSSLFLPWLFNVCFFLMVFFPPYFGLNIDQNWESIILKSKSLINVGEINT